jgi:hypothetical protein
MTLKEGRISLATQSNPWIRCGYACVLKPQASILLLEQQERLENIQLISLGDLCGAVYLDDGFDSTMRTIVGSSVYDKLDSEVKAKVFENEWENGPKRNYNGPHKEPREFLVDIPGYKPKRPNLFSKRPSSTIILKGLV